MGYEKQTWATGDVITADKLNHMEDGIEAGGLPVPTIEDLGKVLMVVQDPDAPGQLLTIIDNKTVEITDSSQSEVIEANWYGGYGAPGLTLTVNGATMEASFNEQTSSYVATSEGVNYYITFDDRYNQTHFRANATGSYTVSATLQSPGVKWVISSLNP